MNRDHQSSYDSNLNPSISRAYHQFNNLGQIPRFAARSAPSAPHPNSHPSDTRKEVNSKWNTHILARHYRSSDRTEFTRSGKIPRLTRPLAGHEIKIHDPGSRYPLEPWPQTSWPPPDGDGVADRVFFEVPGTRTYFGCAGPTFWTDPRATGLTRRNRDSMRRPSRSFYSDLRSATYPADRKLPRPSRKVLVVL